MEHIIRSESLSCQFGKIQAVKELDLQVKDGVICAFLGPNGAGKTTTIRMLLGLIKPSSGRCEVLGFPAGDKRALAQLGAMVESPSLYDHLTGRENVEITRLMRGTPRSEADRVLTHVGLRADANRVVSGYSLGMRQRLGLALALIGNPRLMILDEPTNGLDPAGIQEIRELIRRLPHEMGATIFLSSHLLSEIEQIAQDIVVIHRGRLRYQGSLENFGASGHSWLKARVEDLPKAMEVLLGCGVQAEPHENWLRIRAERDQAPQILDKLVNANVRVHEFGPELHNLEERFLSLVGGE